MEKRVVIEGVDEISEKREEHEVEDEIPQEREGFKFVCEILETIIRDRHEIHSKIKYARENGEGLELEVIQELTKEWKEVSKRILGEEKKISPEEQAEIKENKDACKTVLSDYKDWMECAVKGWKDNKKTAKNRLEEIDRNIDDYKKSLGELDTRHGNIFQSFKSILNTCLSTQNAFFLGFSLTIALSVGNNTPLGDCFCITDKEQKKILFKSLKVMGINHLEFVPDEEFIKSREGFRILLLYALHNAMKIKVSARGTTGHFKWAKCMWENPSERIKETNLFGAIGHSQEVADICKLCQGGLQSYCKSDMLEGEVNERCELTSFYQMMEPYRIQGPYEAEIKNKLLVSERGYQIKALIQGKSGAGKSVFGKAIVLASLSTAREKSEYRILEDYAETLGIDNREYFPLLLRCSELSKDEFKKAGFVKCALRQACEWAKIQSEEKCLEHFEYFINYLDAYCKHKAEEWKMLLILDDFPGAEKEWIELFADCYDRLRKEYENIHIIILSNILPASENRSFKSWGFSLFNIGGFSIEKLYEVGLFDKIGISKEFISDLTKKDHLAREFIDTPNRMIMYASNVKNGKTHIGEIVNKCIENELGKGSGLQPLQCKDFFLHLIKSALLLQENQMRIPGRLLLPQRLFDNEKDFALISGLVRRKSMLIERSAEGINNFEFKNPLYFYSLIAENNLKRMSEREPRADELQSILRLLKDKEVSAVAKLMLDELVDNKYPVLEIGVEIFFKELIARIVYYDEIDNQACLFDAVEIINGDEWNTKFCDKYGNRILNRITCAVNKLKRTL